MTPEPVGSLAEEAAKLVSALSAMQPGAHAGPGNSDDSDDSDAAHAHHDHDAHDELAAECRYCPLCALARAARSMTPEVREHLASAAGSLLLAARGLLDEAVAKAGEADGGAGPEQRVEKIDLAED
jgi:hypothetical protein